MDDTLDDIKVEGELELEPEKETQPDSSSEDKPEEESSDSSQDAKTEEEEKPSGNWNDDPRFQKLIADRNIAREERDSLKEQVETMDEKFEKFQTSQSSDDIPQEFVTLYGDNPKAWKAYQSFENKREEIILKKVREENESQRTQQKAEDARWNKWVDDELSSMTDEGLEFKKNDLIKFMLEWAPTDAEGKYDFRKGHKLMEMSKGSNSEVEAKKKVAAKSSGTSKAEPGSKGYMTPEDIGGRSIRDIIQDELT